jgi:hypothetical protein
MRLFPVTCQVIFLYIGIFQTNWIRKESMIALVLQNIDLLAAEIYVPTLISGQSLVLGTGQKSLLLYPMESI